MRESRGAFTAFFATTDMAAVDVEVSFGGTGARFAAGMSGTLAVLAPSARLAAPPLCNRHQE